MHRQRTPSPRRPGHRLRVLAAAWLASGALAAYGEAAAPCTSELNHHVAALAVVWDAPTTLYAGTSCGVFRGARFGDLWQPINEGLDHLDVHALAIDPKESTTLYAGTHGGGIFKSVDGGRSWRGIHRGLGDLVVRDLAIDPELPSRVYAGTARSGLFLSDNGGRDWRRSFGPADVRRIAIDPKSTSVLYAATRRDVRASTDRGKTWTELAALPRSATYEPSIGADLSGAEILTLEVDPTRRGELFVGTSSGLLRISLDQRSWSRGTLSGPVTALAFDPWDPSTLYAGASGSVHKSEDGGGSWRAISQPETEEEPRKPPPASVFALVVDPFVFSTLYYGTTRGRIARSHDAGVGWTPIDLPGLESRLMPTSFHRPQILPRPADDQPGISLDRPAWKRWKDRFEGLRDTRLQLFLALDLLSRVSTPTQEAVLGVLTAALEETRILERRFRDRRGIDEVTWSPDSRWLAVLQRFDDGSRNRSQIQLFDVDKLWRQSTHDVETGPTTAWADLGLLSREPILALPDRLLTDAKRILAWSPDGRQLVVHDVWNRIVVGSLPPPGAVLSPDREGRQEVLGSWPSAAVAVFEPRGSRLAVALADGSILLWRRPVADQEPEILAGGTQAARHLFFTLRGQTLLAVGDGGEARSWNLRSGAPGRRGSELLAAEPGEVEHAALGPGGRWLAVAREDEPVRVWDLERHGRAHDLKPSMTRAPGSLGSLGSPRRLAFGRSTVAQRRKTWLATGNGLWDLTGELPVDSQVLLGRSPLFSHDGRWLATRSPKGSRSIELVRIDRRVPGHLPALADVAHFTFLRPGRLLTFHRERRESGYGGKLWILLRELAAGKQTMRRLDGDHPPFWNPTAPSPDQGWWAVWQPKRDGSADLLRIWNGLRSTLVRVFHAPDPSLPEVAAVHLPLLRYKEGELETLPSLRRIDDACRYARRHFSAEEWALYAGDRPYREICAPRGHRRESPRPDR